MRIALCTDVHWCKHSSLVKGKGKEYSLRLENCISSLNWFEALSKERHCDAEYFLGDFFDRADLNAEEITALNDIQWSSTPKLFLTGNHEANGVSLDFTATNVFKSKNMEIVSSVKKIEVNKFVDFYFIPYITEDSFKPLRDYFDVSSAGKKIVVFTHNVLAGINYGRYVSSTGFSIDDIVNNCTLFIDGHLHNCGVIKEKIVIAGNLTGLNFTEDATRYKHNAYILDVEGDKICFEPVENPYAYNFYKIVVNSTEEAKSFVESVRNAVVSVTCNSYIKDDVSKVFESANVVAFKMSVTYDNTSYDSEFESFKSNDPISQFIAFASAKLEQSQVLAEELTLLGGNR